MSSVSFYSVQADRRQMLVERLNMAMLYVQVDLLDRRESLGISTHDVSEAKRTLADFMIKIYDCLAGKRDLTETEITLIAEKIQEDRSGIRNLLPALNEFEKELRQGVIDLKSLVLLDIITWLLEEELCRSLDRLHEEL